MIPDAAYRTSVRKARQIAVVVTVCVVSSSVVAFVSGWTIFGTLAALAALAALRVAFEAREEIESWPRR